MAKRLISIVFTLAVLAAAFFTGLFTLYPLKYYETIQKNADKLPPGLICAVIHAESKFRPEARSHKDAAGLMQLTENTAIWMAAEMGMQDFEISRLYEPETNIALGSFFLNWLTDYYDGNRELALCAYNAGMGNVNRWLADKQYSADGKTLTKIPFPETEQYLQRVQQNQKIYDFILLIRRY